MLKNCAFALVLAVVFTETPISLQAAGPASSEESPGDFVEPLVIVEDPPPVQMLVPGFVVRELPVTLRNLNNLRYRADGKLYALGYDGDVWLLSDTDGDGLEETATRFFDSQGRLRGPIGMAVIPEGHHLLADVNGRPLQQARGVVVASKGKVSALLDRDGDDVAETEQIIASGWQEIPQNVDAVGVAIHPDDGAIYFGLGTAAFNNAYLLDENGRSHFDLKSERGTIQRIAPDLSERTTVCTGVRFIIGMDFNDDRELIVTDQEGATWLPNGNPYDELLLIRPGRHYGFPPRHPKHLPQVFDEPSLFDYGPQHQSTCGLAFNRPHAPGGPIFGPESWRGDVFVCGESRGKLYRTQLTKDANGELVAANQIIGCLGMLTVDCCISPRGDLLVACHSGGPDWGTGPTGEGKIFAIRYSEGNVALPVSVWAAGPQEVHVAFDRALDPGHLQALAPRTMITYGEYVAAADRFESIRPGYAVTELQQSKPRYRLPVHSVSVTPDRRTLILSTATHPAAVQYALTLPGLGRETLADVPGTLPQHPEVDLAYALTGVRATWTPHDPNVAGWTGWLPHLDLGLAQTVTRGDLELDRLWKAIEQPGTLIIETQFDLRGLFSPAVQPGSTLDYESAEDRWIQDPALHMEVPMEAVVDVAGGRIDVSAQPDSQTQRYTVHLDRESPDPVSVSIQIPTGGARPSVGVSWSATFGDGRSRSGPLALHRFVLPWVRLDAVDPAPASPRVIPELAGGSWGRGRRIFLSETAGCAKCHVAHGTGGEIGPDLSNLIHRDYASVHRDLTQPSFAINPDYITYVAALRDGRVLTGAIRTERDQLLIGDKEGKVIRVHRDDVERLQPSSLSVMPEKLSEKLEPQQMRDLLTFLLQSPPRMPHDSPLPEPPPRTRDEVSTILAGSEPEFSFAASAPSAPNPQPPQLLRILLVAGAKDHGPGEHDYPAWLTAWSQLLEAAEAVAVTTAMEWPTEEQLQAADTIAFFQKGSWNAERAAAIDTHLAKGGGLVYIHWAVEGGPQAPAFAQRIGLASHAAQLKYRHGPLELGFETGRGHPIARNFDRVHFHDESYWLMQGDPSRIRVIGTGMEDGAPRPLFWTYEPSAGRVFVSIPGHYSWTFDDPLFRILLLRGLAWSARESVDRFNDLSVLGVTLAD